MEYSMRFNNALLTRAYQLDFGIMHALSQISVKLIVKQ